MVGVVLVAMAVWMMATTLVVIGEARALGTLEQRIMRGGRVLMSGDGLPVGEMLPECPVRDLETGVESTLQVAKRRLLVVLVSATCSPCRTLAASLRSLYRNWGQCDVVFLCRGKRESVELLRAQLPPTVRLLWDAHDAAKDAFECSLTPYAFLFDRRGRLALKGHCGNEEDLNALVLAELDGVPASGRQG